MCRSGGKGEKAFPHWGGAPRSESKITMIAGGNHTSTNRWQPEGLTDEGTNIDGDCHASVRTGSQ